MSRTITAASETASKAEHVAGFMLVKMEFDSADVDVTNAARSILFNGDTYAGLGDLGKLSTVEEGADIKARTLTFNLSGVNTAQIAILLGEQYMGRPVSVWLALVDTDHVLIDDPVFLWGGLMDTMDINADVESDISVTAQSRLVRWENGSNRRFNNATQQRDYPSDLGFEFVEKMVEQEIIWPKG